MTKTRHPATEIRPIAVALLEELVRVKVVVRAELAGSLRRRTEQVGDIEVLAIPAIETQERADPQLELDGTAQTQTVVSNKLWDYLDIKAERKQIEYRKRGPKYRQFLLDGIQVDLFTAEKGNWGWTHLVRTGSSSFSHSVAGALNRHGYTSKEAWIRPLKGEPRKIETPTEHHVFRLAGMEWLEPTKRSW